jgi:hypothetical protein
LTVAFSLTLSAYLLILSAKGLTDLFFLVAPFFFCDAAGSERDASTRGAR